MYSPSQLLDQPVERAARLVALDLLEAATKARARLDDPGDAEALHHFRVSLRRLRTWLRGLRPWLEGSVPKKARRRLAKAARRTSDSRDAEVHLGWLQDQRSELTARQRHGWAWLVEQLEDEKQRSDAIAFTKGTRAFDRAAATLSRKLPFYRAHVDADAVIPQPFAIVLAELIRDQGTALAECLTKIGSLEDGAKVHDARIAGKRLRYLVEPIADEVPGAERLVSTLEQLQDALGNWHDAQVFSKVIVDASDSAPAVRPAAGNGRSSSGKRPSQRRQDLRLGLLALAGRLQERGERGFGIAKERWLVSTTLAEDTEAVAHALAARIGRSLPKPMTTVVSGDGRAADEALKDVDAESGRDAPRHQAGRRSRRPRETGASVSPLRRIEESAVSQSPGA